MSEVAELNPKVTLSPLTAAVTNTCMGSDCVRCRMVVRWWWVSGRNQERLHGGSDLGLFFKAFEFGFKITPYSGAFCSNG